jgi:hypothetical protein
MDTLILNFFHDGICRLIPGIVVICLYGNNLVTLAHKTLKNSFVFLAVCIFLIAWFIGATLDTFTFAPAYYIPQIRNALISTNQLAKMNAQRAEALAQKDENDAQKFERVQKVRMYAEIELFRIMMCISLFTCILPPKKLFSIVWPSTTFSDSQWTRWYNKNLRPRFPGIIGTAVFLICWWFGRKLMYNLNS